MSTMILNPVFSYFSPFLRREAAHVHPSEAPSRDLAASIAYAYFRTILNMAFGAVLFLLSALPALLLFLIATVLSKNGLANTSGFALTQLAAQACLGLDLLLFLVYCGRTLLRAIRQI